MQDLYYILRLDKPFHRRALILTTLAEHNYHIKSDLLVQQLSWSLSTLRTDIDTLNLELSQYLTIQLDTHGVIHLDMRVSHISIEYVITLLAQKTTIYQLILFLFQKRRWSIVEAIDELLISRSTLLNTIKDLNQFLTLYQIRISTKNMQLEGKESSIRIFFFDFFSVFGTLFSPTKLEYSTVLRRIRKEKGAPYLNLCHYRTNLWIQVTITRWAMGHYVAIDPDLQDLISHSIDEFISFQKIQSILLSYVTNVQKLPQQEWMWVYFTTLDCISYSESINQEYRASDYTFVRKHPQSLTDEVNRLIAEVEETERLPKICYDRVYAFLVNLSYLSRIDSAFEIVVPYQLKAMVQESCQIRVQQWFNALQRLDSSQLTFTHLEDIAVSLSILDLSIPKHERDFVRVVFAYQGDKGYDGFLVEYTRSLLPDHVIAEFFLERTPSLLYLEKYNIQLLVSNYNLSNQIPSGCKYVMLPAIPYEADWIRLQNVLSQL